MKNKIKLKNDRYSSARGDNSKVLVLHCSSCNAFLLKYQKDGNGGLFRLYIDRIIEPPMKFDDLKCSCGNLIGTTMIYEKEKRPAIRLVRGSYVKAKE
jgi:hypothetical protein